MTAEDVPGVNDCGPVVHDDPIFAVEKVSFVGQSVFAIVAENMAAARLPCRWRMSTMICYQLF